MSDYSSLKATINANVKANNNHEITGSIMNSVLNAMVDSLGAGYQFMGVATPTNPGSAQTPDYKCFYLATTPGTYTNLGGLVVADGEVALLKYDTSWTKEVSGIASADKLNQLGQYEDNSEYLYVMSDKDGRFLLGVRPNGKIVYGGGLPEQVILALAEKVDKIAGKGLSSNDFTDNNKEFVELNSIDENPEYLYVMTDKDDRFLFGIKKNGTIYWARGVPESVKDELLTYVNIITTKKINEIAVSYGILDFYPLKTTKPLLANLKLPGYQWGDNWAFPNSTLVLMWFSDIHGNAENLARISDFHREYGEYIDDVIHTGDFLLGSWGDDFSYWGDNGASNFLNILGNHDPAGTPTYGFNLVSPKACYDRYILPFLAEWDANNVNTISNKCYWYKDYPNAKSEDCPGGIRLIGLDRYHWKETLHPWGSESIVTEYPDGVSVDTGEQEDWFVALLNDAKENGLAVMVAVHGPTNSVTKIDCTFDTLDARASDATNTLTSDMIQDVQDFIDAGGCFITWMTGHTHQDWFAKISSNPEQLIVCIDTASYTMMWRGAISMVGTNSMDKIDLLSIDPVKKYIRLYRVGLDYDRQGRHLGSLVYNYATKQIIFNS